MNNADRKIKLSTIVCAIFAIIAGYFLVIGILIYGFGVEGRIVKKTANFIPYPAAIVDNTNFIAIRELEDTFDSVKMFYESQDFSDTGLRVDFLTDEGKKRLLIKKKNLLNRMIDNLVIERSANQRGIILTDEMISQEVDRQLKESGSGVKALENIKKLYGWDIAEFSEKLVKPDMYKEKLMQSVKESDKDNLGAQGKIEKARKELQDKKDFSVVAENYSEGDSAKNGGDLGWLSADQMLPELAEISFSLKKGEISDIVESALGFHIIEVEDNKTEGSVDKVKIKQIFVRTTDFSDWLIKQEKDINIYIPIKNFYWNKDTGEVEFADDELNKFEENLDENSSGDVSVLF